MSINKAELSKHPFYQLPDQLSQLRFDPAKDLPVSTLPFLKDYLQHYQLQFPLDCCRAHFMGTVQTGGYTVVAQYWLPTLQPAKGTVFVLHGYYDHVGILRHLIHFLLEQGYVVVAYDQPGHGLSSGERASIRSFCDYVTVLQDCLANAIHLPTPCFGIGQSTGGAVLLHHLLVERRNDFKGIILLAPLIKPAGWRIGVWVYRLLKPLVSKIPRSYAKSSHDPAFVKFIRDEDPLQPEYLSLVWVGAMKEWLDQFRFLPPLSAHGLVIQGEGDQTVAWKENIAHIQQKVAGLEYSMIKPARHHLANESAPIREQIFTRIQQFLLAST